MATNNQISDTSLKNLSYQDIFENIKSGKLTPSKEDSTWTSMYVSGMATPAQMRAYNMWEDFSKQNPNYVRPSATPSWNDVLKADNKDQFARALNQNLLSDFEESEKSLVPTKTSLTDPQNLKSSMDYFKDIFTQGQQRPQMSFSDTFQQIREDSGVSELEKQMDMLKAEARETEAILRQRVQGEEGKRVAMGVIGGRVSEIERQEKERLDFIRREQAYLNDTLNTKYNVINQIMNMQQMDYQNAVQNYDKTFSENIQVMNIMRGIESEAKSREDKETDTARANLQIIYNQLGDGLVSLSDMPEDTKNMISKLEMQSGLPVGMFDLLSKKNPQSKVVSQSPRTGQDGSNYIDFVMRDSQGKMFVETVSLGKSLSDKVISSTARTTASGSKFLDIVRETTPGNYEKQSIPLGQERLPASATSVSEEDKEEVEKKKAAEKLQTEALKLREKVLSDPDGGNIDSAINTLKIMIENSYGKVSDQTMKQIRDMYFGDIKN